MADASVIKAVDVKEQVNGLYVDCHNVLNAKFTKAQMTTLILYLIFQLDQT
jgi:hypothetical protein